MAERHYEAYEPIVTQPQPEPVTHLNYRVLALLAGVVLSLGIVGTVLWHTGGTSEPRPEDAPTLPPSPGGDFTAGMPRHYDQIPAPPTPPKPPVAMALPPIMPTPAVQIAPAPSPAVVAQVPLQPFPVVPPPTTVPPSGGTPPMGKPEPKGRTPKTITPIALNSPANAPGQGNGGTPEKSRPSDSGQLIHPALWERPVKPLLTIYRSQILKGTTLQAISTDVPGPLTIQLTEDVRDKFGYERVILPTGSVIVAKQEGTPRYGQSRINIRLEQIELPTSEVISLKAAVGDKDGNGVGGKVNNHYGKLVVAAGLSALLNIGAGTIAGTPGRGQFFQDAGQQAAQDAGRSIQRDASSIVDRELRVPPTITVPANAPVTISLEENIQFNRPATLVR